MSSRSSYTDFADPYRGRERSLHSPPRKQKRTESYEISSTRQQQSSPAVLAPSKEAGKKSAKKKGKQKKRRSEASGGSAEPLPDYISLDTAAEPLKFTKSVRRPPLDQFQEDEEDRSPAAMHPSRTPQVPPDPRFFPPSRPPLLGPHGLIDQSGGASLYPPRHTPPVVDTRVRGPFHSPQLSPSSHHLPPSPEPSRGGGYPHSSTNRLIHWQEASPPRENTPRPLFSHLTGPFTPPPPHFRAPPRHPVHGVPECRPHQSLPVHATPPQSSVSMIRESTIDVGPPSTSLDEREAREPAFPNPDTPDETVPPAHPLFYPRMAPASSSLSTRLSFTDVRGRPDHKMVVVKKISDRLDAIIDDLASTGKFVPDQVVKDFGGQLVRESRRAGCHVHEREIEVLGNYSKLHGRITQLIHMFCWMSPITTLHELEKALVLVEKVATFQELRIGPLIKHPMVAKFFQPPEDMRETPEITAHQIQKTLMKFIDKKRKERGRGEKLSMQEFLVFFAKSLSKPSPHHLCVRITSFPLAMQTNFAFRRMQREARNRVQGKIEEEIMTVIIHEVDQVRRRLSSLSDPRAALLAQKEPTTLITEIFALFMNYLTGHQSARVNAFLQLICFHENVKRLFLWAVYLGAYGIERVTREAEEGREVQGTPHYPSHYAPQPQLFHRTHGEVLDVLLPLLKRQPFPISLSSLSELERAVAERFDVASFHPLTRTSFLDFIVCDPQCTAALGGSLTIGAPAVDASGKKRVLDIVSQLRRSERNDKDVVSETLKLQCRVTTIDQISCGSVEKIISDTNERVDPNSQTQSCVSYLSPLLVNGASDGSRRQWSSQSFGALGDKTREEALSCLCRAPLLDDLASWSHWDQLFNPQHGELAGFVEKEGSEVGLHVLEVAPSVLLRVDPLASHQKFLEALEARDSVGTSGQLVSVVVQQGSVHEVSMQLLGSHVQTALDRMVYDSTQPSHETGADQHSVSATEFVYQCLLCIPLQLCQYLAKEVFMEPLRRATSTAAVEALLDQWSCGVREDKRGRRHLQSLGMSLGIKAWTDDFSTMLDEQSRSREQPKSKPQTSAKPSKSVEQIPIQDLGGTDMEVESVPTITEATVVMPEREEDGVEGGDQVSSVPMAVGVADPEREAECRSVIESIRCEDFGVGLELEGRQKEVAQKQRQREGRGLQRLSKELYSKDTHFVLELIQNADDNSYSESLLSASPAGVPALKFIVGPATVTVLNNEVGFSEQNIRAICDVGCSTKSANHSGYIGQKGIGFKSVFRITDTPAIHSGGYHIRFDAKCDAIGYILPHWLEEQDRVNTTVENGWSTTIVLPLKGDQVSLSLVRKFQDVRPSLLLFLHRLRSITVEDQELEVTKFMRRSDGNEGIIQIEHNTDEGGVEQDKWLVVRKHLTNASQFKTEVEVTEVALAFPLGADMKTVTLAKDLQQQQVFAFLPLRSYGFRFIVQGDFDLPSSREDVNSDSVWNQFLRDEIPHLFLHALDKMKKLPGISVTDAVALFLQFVPLDGELHDFFKPVAIRIRNLLRGAACLPTEPGSEEDSDPFSIVQSRTERATRFTDLWKQPSELVIARDSFIRRAVPQSLLNSSLHYHYLNSDLISFVSPTLRGHLGLRPLSVDHLIVVAEALVRSYSGASTSSVIMLGDDSDEEDAPILISDDEEMGGSGDQGDGASHTPHSVFVHWVAKWLACVHIVLEEEGDRSPVTLGKLKKTKIIPLTNGARVAAQESRLFFPPDGDSASSAGFKCLFDEIMVVDPQLFEARVDQEETAMVKISHRVHSLLELLGVREMYPAEVIRHHILPCFHSQQWKRKSTALLTAYLAYIKGSLATQGSGIREGEIVPQLRDCVALVTKNHGPLQPSKEVLHLSSQFQPSYDLEKLFPDVQWKLVSPGYLKRFSEQSAASSWRHFLLNLGVRDKIVVGTVTEKIPEGHDRWSELREFVGRSPDRVYTLRDYRSSEFEEIVTSAKTSEKHDTHQQMLELLRLLDTLWDKEYWQFSFGKCYDGSNEHYLGGDKSIPSAFHRALKDLAWIPAVYLPSRKPYGAQNQLYRGCELFDCSISNQRLLDRHVPYVACEIKNPKLVELLQVKCQVSAEDMIGFLQEWSKIASTPGNQFRASISHMTEVYLYLHQQSQQMYSSGPIGESITDTLSSSEQSLVFVPDAYDSNVSPTECVSGQFYSVHNVCWIDPSGVLYTQQKRNHKIPSDIPKVLQLHYGCEESERQKYQALKNAFQSFRVRETPTAAAYISTLQFISSLAAIPEKHHINDFSSIALHLSRVCMKGDINPQFLQQQLRGKKVFPSHRDLWVSLDGCLLENDDTQLQKVFGECKDVHFLRWPEAVVRHRVPRNRQYEEQQKEEERTHFVDVCGIAKLSEVVSSMVVPDKGSVMPLENLRRRLHVMVPLIQRYLVTNEEDIYASLVQENMKGKLEKMFIASILSLKCLYSIHHRGVTYNSPHQSSPGSDFVDSTEYDNAALYVVASKVDSPKVLVPTLVKIFSGKNGKLLDQSHFEALVKDMLMSPIGEMDVILSDQNYTFGEVPAEEAWDVPFQEEPEPSESEPEEEDRPVSGGASPEDERMDTEERDDAAPDTDSMKSWPPRAPPVSIGSSSSTHPPRPPPPGSAVADAVGEKEIQNISEKYDMERRRVAKPPSRVDQRSLPREDDHGQSRDIRSDSAVARQVETQRKEAVGPRLDKQRQRGEAECSGNSREDTSEQRIRSERHSTPHESAAKPATVDRNTESPREFSGDGMAVGSRKGQKWQQAVQPHASLFTHSSFSIAATLQPVSVESAREFLNRSFLDSCEQDSQERVGRWGEEYVYKYLTAADSLPSGQRIRSVTWINESTETGKPYDIEVEIEPQTVLYIEVKSTKSSEKEFMEFSWNQLKFADREKHNYHLYRVYSAGSELVTLKWMDNLSDILTTRPVRLFLEL